VVYVGGRTCEVSVCCAEEFKLYSVDSENQRCSEVGDLSVLNSNSGLEKNMAAGSVVGWQQVRLG
jgi:hypothetical protein